MPRPLRRSPGPGVLAALVRGCVLVLALVVIAAAATPVEAVPGGDVGPVVVEVAPDEPPAVAPAPAVSVPAPAPAVVAGVAPARAWSSRSAPPPVVPPPER